MKIDFDADDLKPLVAQVVSEVLEQTADDNARFAGRLAFPEAEAAALLGIKPTVLRACRGRQEIVAFKAGRKIMYSREELKKFMKRQRQD